MSTPSLTTCFVIREVDPSADGRISADQGFNQFYFYKVAGEERVLPDEMEVELP